MITGISGFSSESGDFRSPIVLGPCTRQGQRLLLLCELLGSTIVISQQVPLPYEADVYNSTAVFEAQKTVSCDAACFGCFSGVMAFPFGFWIHFAASQWFDCFCLFCCISTFLVLSPFV